MVGQAGEELFAGALGYGYRNGLDALRIGTDDHLARTRLQTGVGLYPHDDVTRKLLGQPGDAQFYPFGRIALGIFRLGNPGTCHRCHPQHPAGSLVVGELHGIGRRDRQRRPLFGRLLGHPYALGRNTLPVGSDDNVRGTLEFRILVGIHRHGDFIARCLDMKPRGPLLGGGRPRQPLTHGSHRNLLRFGAVGLEFERYGIHRNRILRHLAGLLRNRDAYRLHFRMVCSRNGDGTAPLFGSLVVAHGHGKRFRIGLGNGQPLLRSAGHLVRPLHGDGFHGESLTRIAARGKFQSQRIYF